MLYKKIFIFMFCLGIHNLLEAEEATPVFLIKKDDNKKTKRMSRNALKESIGKKAKKSFDATVALAQSIGSIQIALSHIQKKSLQENKEDNSSQDLLNAFRATTKLQHTIGLLQIKSAHVQNVVSYALTRLIDNAQPFKKADKDPLHKTLNVVKKLSFDIKKQVKLCEDFRKRISSVTKQESLPENLIKNAQNVCSEVVKSLKRSMQQLAEDECLKQV